LTTRVPSVLTWMFAEIKPGTQLTSDGLQCLKSSHAAVEGIESEMLQGISSSAQGQLASLLLRCAENLEAALDAPARRA